MTLTGVTHIHSTYSYDGKVELEKLRELFLAEGISFALMSEHTDALTNAEAMRFVAECKERSDESFLFIPGFEVPYLDAHILFFGAEYFVSQKADEEALRRWREVAPLCILAHPVRNNFLLDEAMREVIDGVEIWNQQYDGKRVPRPRSYRLLEKLRKERSGLIATGGLDLHRPEHLTYPRVQLEVDRLTPSNITNALRKGRFVFGQPNCTVRGKGEWTKAGSVSARLQSAVSIALVGLGKGVNRALASLGLRLPSGLVRSIRSHV